MANQKYDWIIKDYDYKHTSWAGGSLIDLLNEMDAAGWELVSSFGTGQFRDQGSSGGKLIFRRQVKLLACHDTLTVQEA